MSNNTDGLRQALQIAEEALEECRTDGEAQIVKAICESIRAAMDSKLFPELMGDAELDGMVDRIWESCGVDCAKCKRRDELGKGKGCERDVLFELWRHWMNLREGK